MRFCTPLRYPGGKGKLSNFMLKLIEDNNLSHINYAEPYAGGAGLALKLLYLNAADKIILNDIDFSVYAFWYSVINDADLLCSKIEDTEVTIEEWYKQKDVIINHRNHEMLTVGFATFFLNRTNRSGILNGGVIGGKKQAGIWKIDERFNKKNLIDRIMNIYSKRHMIDLYNLDAVEFIKKIVVNLPRNSLTYLDPPYYLKGKELYVNHYKHQDHVDLARVVRKIKTPWVVSYDNTDEIQKMYRGPSLVYGINYSAQDRYKGSEVMFFRKNLNIPETKDPIKMKVPKIYSAGCP